MSIQTLQFKVLLNFHEILRKLVRGIAHQETSQTSKPFTNKLI